MMSPPGPPGRVSGNCGDTPRADGSARQVNWHQLRKSGDVPQLMRASGTKVTPAVPVRVQFLPGVKDFSVRMVSLPTFTLTSPTPGAYQNVRRWVSGVSPDFRASVTRAASNSPAGTRTRSGVASPVP